MKFYIMDNIPKKRFYKEYNFLGSNACVPKRTLRHWKQKQRERQRQAYLTNVSSYNSNEIIKKDASHIDDDSINIPCLESERNNINIAEILEEDMFNQHQRCIENEDQLLMNISVNNGHAEDIEMEHQSNINVSHDDDIGQENSSLDDEEKMEYEEHEDRLLSDVSEHSCHFDEDSIDNQNNINVSHDDDIGQENSSSDDEEEMEYEENGDQLLSGISEYSNHFDENSIEDESNINVSHNDNTGQASGNSNNRQQEDKNQILHLSYNYNNYSYEVLIAILLVMAIHLRYRLSYSVSQVILRLVDIGNRACQSKTSKYHYKNIINMYSDYLFIHHICSDRECGAYIGEAPRNKEKNTTAIMQCPRCRRLINEKINFEAGNVFLYLSLEKQLTDYFINVNDQHLYSSNRKKKQEYALEDIYDGDGYRNGQSDDIISLNFSADGTPIFKSSLTSIHPVLCTINELGPRERKNNMMLACLSFSNKKLKMNEYLRPFVDEAKKLYNEGFSYTKHGITYHKKVRILAGICDTVERPLLRCSTQFNGENGCGLCLNKGTSVKKGKGHVLVYPLYKNDNPFGKGLRNHNDTLKHARTKEYGIKDRSILCDIPKFDIINNLHVEWMHCVGLGVCRQFIKMWFKSSNNEKNFYVRRYLNKADKLLLSYKPSLEVSRTPRKISDHKHWKAHEFVVFLLFYSIPVLKDILSSKLLNHWSLLVDGVAILLKDSIMRSEIDYAEKCLLRFVKEVKEFYGVEYMSINVHLLTHLAQNVLYWGPLWAHSAFWYEDFNQELKNYVKSSQGVAEQICNTFRIRNVVKKLKILCWPELSEAEKTFLDNMLNKKNEPEITEIVGNSAMIGLPKNVIPPLPRAYYLALQRLNITCTGNLMKYYYRALVNGEMIHSRLYTKPKKRCSYFALLVDGNIFEIEIFLAFQSNNGATCRAIGYYYDLDKTPLIKDRRLQHLVKLKKKKNDLATINIDDIREKVIIINMEKSDSLIACIYPSHQELLT